MALLFLGDPGHARRQNSIGLGGVRRALGYRSFDQSSLLSLLPFLAGWAIWPSRGDSRSLIRFSAAATISLCHRAGSLDHPQLPGVRKIHRSAIEFRLGIVAREQPRRAGYMVALAAPERQPGRGREIQAHGRNCLHGRKKSRKRFAFMRTHPGDTLHFMFRRFINNWLAITDSPADTWSASPFYLKGIHRPEFAAVFVHVVWSLVLEPVQARGGISLLDGSAGLSA